MFTNKSAPESFQLSAAFRGKSSALVRKLCFQCEVSKTRCCWLFRYYTVSSTQLLQFIYLRNKRLHLHTSTPLQIVVPLKFSHIRLRK